MPRTLLCLLALALSACGTASAGAGGGSGSSGEGTPADPSEPQGERPAGAAELSVQQDLVQIVHLADVDHHGLFVDFGTAARNPYTIGRWRTGWGTDGADGDETFTRVGR